MPTVLQVVAGCAAAALAVVVRAADTSGGDLRADLERLAAMRVVFGHQSVGAGLVAGVERLTSRAGAGLRVVELAVPGIIAPGTFAHAFVARNGDPRRKLASFEDMLSRLPSPPDVALLKFCYVDFDASTDAESLFVAYAATLGRLERRYPATRFVHVTAPLTTVQGGLKGALKRVFGRAPAGFAENARREAYNARLRAAFAGPALFDLARLEAASHDGAPTQVGFGGETVLALAPESTTDGGHLARAAEDRIARALVAQLARLRAAAP